MKELRIFSNEKFGEVRTVEMNGEPHFVLADVCRVLEIKNTTDVAKRLDEDERSRFNLGRQGEAITINESGLYAVILRSDKPQAKAFRKWITSEVLPTIRKTGGYVDNDDLFINTYLSNADEQTKVLFKSTLAVVNNLNARIKADRPKVIFSDAVSASSSSILIGELAKLLRQNGCEIGQNRLFQWLRAQGYLMKGGSSYNMPTQRAMELGLFQVRESTVTNPDGSVRVTSTTKVTGKGQLYFINKFISDSKGEAKRYEQT